MGETILVLLVLVIFFMQDQYINHIMNETGVTVALRGRDLGNLGSCHGEG